MKPQTFELPLGKPQKRKKTSKVIPLIALTFILTIIPIYYPSFLVNLKKISEAPSSFDSLGKSTAPCFLKDDGSQPCNSKDDVLVEAPIVTNGDAKERLPSPEEINSRKHDLAVAEAKDDENSETVPSPSKGRGNQSNFGTPKGSKEAVRGVPTDGDGEVVDHNHAVLGDNGKSCDLFSGEWVPNPDAPYYTNATCSEIQDHQNCLKNGRPDTGFLTWRWKPDGCELPIFDPHQFLEIVRGKSFAFVGDSVARNHMQSLICLLSGVASPVDISNSEHDGNRHHVYGDYNFNISIFWAPYLVRAERTDPNDVTKPFNLYLDEFDEDWRSQIQRYDYVIISAGQWFSRPTYSYLDDSLYGCVYCKEENITHFAPSFSYGRAFRTAFRAIYSLKNFKGVTFMRTFALSHFENGDWNKGGDCVRTRPFKRNETSLEDERLDMYKAQLEELEIAQKEGRKRGLKFRLIDATHPMLLRPDGHPSKYWNWPKPNPAFPNDCVHWCLPGPIDTWNEFLLELMKREEADKPFRQ